jgi:predicted flap endonuclease-1-like 5' DNA nuclease
MSWSWGRFLVTLIVGLVCALLYWAFFHKRGRRYEETFDRVVEESTDESTKISALASEHAMTLKSRDEMIAALRADHENALELLRSELEGRQAEISRLAGQRDAALTNDSTDARSIAELRSELETASNRIASLLAERDSTATRVQELIAERDSARGAGDADRRALADLRAQLDGCSGRLQALTAELAATRADHESAHAQVLSLTGQPEDPSAPPDDLLAIEGIGPKIDAALRAAGITRWVHVRDASEEQLTAAINAAGIRLAPSIATWSRQAEFLVKGDRAGFDAFVAHLVAGREPGRD